MSEYIGVVIVLVLLATSVAIGMPMFKDIFGKYDGPRCGGDYR